MALSDVAVRPVGAPQDGAGCCAARRASTPKASSPATSARPGAGDAVPGGRSAATPGAGSAESARAPSEQAAFSFTVSHDLRAPIRVVEGFTRIVKEDYGRLLDRVGNDHLDRVLARRRA